MFLFNTARAQKFFIAGLLTAAAGFVLLYFANETADNIPGRICAPVIIFGFAQFGYALYLDEKNGEKI